MSTSSSAADGEAMVSNTFGHRESLPKAPSSPSSGTRGQSSPGPWRPSSLAGRSSPALVNSSTFRETNATHSGMTALRSSGAGAERQKTQFNNSSGTLSSNVSGAGNAWVSSSKRATNTAGYAQTERSSGDHYSPASATASPVLGSFSSFARSSQATTPTPSSLSSPSVPTIVTGMSPSAGPGAGVGASTGPGVPSSNANTQEQPLNMEALAAKFADSKETEKFATLQLSPALTPSSLPDKDRRGPMGSFGSSTVTSHMAHIKVQRTASLNHNAHPNALTKGGKLQPGHLAQPTDMRRTASHNNAFSSGLGLPVGSGLENANPTHTGSYIGSTSGAQGHSALVGALGGASGLAPFSLGHLARSPRRSSLNTPESANQHDQGFSSQNTLPSPLIGDKHPLQHPWTLYYDLTTGYGRQGSSLHNYENGLRDLGTFTTVELFARYFNWIQKPHKIENSANYHLFKDGIKPMWEDPANTNGGRWIITLVNKNAELLDRCWMELAYALVGEQLDVGDDICGAVLSRRQKADRLAVWVRDKENVGAINGIGKRLIQILDLAKEKITMEFQVTSDVKSLGVPKSYITLDAIRKELALETQAIMSTPLTLSENKKTTSHSQDSVPVTPVSITEPSPTTPQPRANSDNSETLSGISETQSTMSTSVSKGSELRFEITTFELACAD
ncbi:hypothetical protein BGX28_010180 [Mortierella sp. GBA30]|nr:hypothetical protein BGX28_010180 [Mortierella sp. GBA30]